MDSIIRGSIPRDSILRFAPILEPRSPIRLPRRTQRADSAERHADYYLVAERRYLSYRSAICPPELGSLYATSPIVGRIQNQDNACFADCGPSVKRRFPIKYVLTLDLLRRRQKLRFAENESLGLAGTDSSDPQTWRTATISVRRRTSPVD